MSIELLIIDFEKANYLLSLLVSYATGKGAYSSEYESLRHALLSNPSITEIMPWRVRANRNLARMAQVAHHRLP